MTEPISVSGSSAETSRMAPATAKKGVQRFSTRVVENLRPSENLSLLSVEFDPPADFRHESGQWCYLFAPGPEGEARNPYSIASAPGEGRLDFCVKKVAAGGVANWLYHRRVGDRVEASSALGTFKFKSPPGRTVVLMATGTGVAPLRAMLHEQWRKGDARDVWLFLGSGHRRGLPYHEEWERAAQERPGFHYVPTLSKAETLEWAGRRGWIQEHFLHEFRHRTDFDAYVCGVRRMVDDVTQLLTSRGVPPQQVFKERYD